MVVHKSHSRKDLIDIIEIYEFYHDCLDDYREQPKETLKKIYGYSYKKKISYLLLKMIHISSLRM